jgi:hypothetical protein
MSSEVPIEIEDKPTAVNIMRELVEHLQDTMEARKRVLARNPKSHEYRKALKGTGERTAESGSRARERRGRVPARRAGASLNQTAAHRLAVREHGDVVVTFRPPFSARHA